jgi:peptidoglycan/LPS O-acetylase OafA/YrhL
MDSERRIPSLDGIRAIAISLVLYAHAWVRTHTSGERTDFGTLGVYIFFVLSGFLITGLMIRESELNQSVSLRNFYTRRFFRIIPPLLLFLFGVKILASLGLAAATNRALLFNLSFFRNYHPGPPIFDHLWSLSVEEQFYLVWPFLFVRFSKQTLTRLLTAVVVIVPIVRLAAILWLGGKYEWHTEQVADGLAWGCLLAIRQPDLRANRYYQWFSRSYAALILPFVILLGAHIHPLKLEALVGKSALFICVALTIDMMIVRYDSVPGKFLNAAPIAWLGRISYSLYLWQQIFFYGGREVYTQFPANLCLAFLCAVFSFYCIERPAIRLGRLIVGRRPQITVEARSSQVAESAV